MVTSSELKPIRTKYHGVEFKSRFESEVAMLLDKMGWSWEYEPESFLLPSGHYMPDFGIIFHGPDGPITAGYVEVRGYGGRDWQMREFARERPRRGDFIIFNSDDMEKWTEWWDDTESEHMRGEYAVLVSSEYWPGYWWFYGPVWSWSAAMDVTRDLRRYPGEFLQHMPILTVRRGRIMIDGRSVTEWRPARGRR